MCLPRTNWKLKIVDVLKKEWEQNIEVANGQKL